MYKSEKKLEDVKAYIILLKPITNWEKINVGETYHIPNIASLERRDIKVVTKGPDELMYKKIGSVDEELKPLHRTSIFAKFMIQKKTY